MNITLRSDPVSLKLRRSLGVVFAVFLAVGATIALSAQQPTHYVRYAHAGVTSFGIREGDTVRALRGDLFQDPQPTGRTYNLSEVELLVPLDWRDVSKIIGVGVNAVGRDVEPEPVPHPLLFTKFPQTLVTDGSEIEVLPEMAETRLIYEGELVVVIGKAARHVSVADAPDYIFGVAIGHDVSQFDWWWNGSHGEGMNGQPGNSMPGDVQGKGSETFSGIGTDIVAGVDYNNLMLTIRKNGEVVSQENTNRIRNKPAWMVSYLSRYITLLPGDLIYLGCLCGGRPDLSRPDQQLLVGDTIEIELERVGTLRQTVVAATVPDN